MELNKDTLIKVTNRSTGTVGYQIPDLGNLKRLFQPKETKEIPYEELQKLSYIPGGSYLLENCLIIDNPDAVYYLLHAVEPEYYYTEENIRDVLDHGTLDQLKDCLDFAPAGVIDSLKQIAVNTRLNDMSKREAILAATGFNVTTAIAINDESKIENTKDNSPKRRIAPMDVTNHDEKPKRRSSIPEYKVTSISK